jgi:peptidoglycan/xylan/chitin deacetylase (PgdA/CDA1 family)
MAFLTPGCRREAAVQYRTIPVKATLTYHSIDDSGSPVSLPPRVFEAHLRWLTSGRIRVVPLDDLPAHPDDGGDAVAVTFDDGFLNVREGVDTLLASGVPVSLFVVSGRVGQTNAWREGGDPGVPTLPLLGWADLERLAARGATIAAHTRTHPRLTHLSGRSVDDELAGGREDLRVRLGAESVHIAYPYGDVNAAVTARAAKSYRFGHTTDFRVLAAAAKDAPLLLPRLDMYYFQAPGSLEAWGTPRFRRRVAWCRLRRAARRSIGV